MNRKFRNVPILLALAAFGCQPAPPANSSEAPAKGAVAGTGTKADPKTGEQAPAAEKPTVDQIPAELKTEAFYYYGLNNTKPMDMEIIDSQAPGQPKTGTQVAVLKEIKDGKAIFDVERTGNLMDLGSQEVTLEKGGVYVTEVAIAQIDHELELPSDLTPGKTWESVLKVDTPGRSVNLKNSFKVVGKQQVKTKVADRDAILITSTGTGTMQNQAVRIESKNWYVRDLGGVKSVINIIPTKGKTRTMTIQETK
jgi:hypothetical protein